VPEIFAQAVPRDIAFLHLEMNSSGAEDAFFDAQGYKVLELPTGQGLVVI
jgi:hypothetical protein